MKNEYESSGIAFNSVILQWFAARVCPTIGITFKKKKKKKAHTKKHDYKKRKRRFIAVNN